jgi:hypothetical protein
MNSTGQKEIFPEERPAFYEMVPAFMENIKRSFTSKQLKNMPETLQRLIECYGAETVKREVERWLAWCAANPRKAPKKNAARGLNSWFSHIKAYSVKSAAPVLDEKLMHTVKSVIAAIWENWPGSRTGQRNAEQVLYNRLKALDTSEKREIFKCNLQSELEALASEERDQKYIPTLARFIEGVSDTQNEKLKRGGTADD